MSHPRPMVTLCASGARLPIPRGSRSLLEILELHQITVEYQCRSGYCGACRTRLLKGRVTYQQSPLATLAQDEILPCCCLPMTDIELEM